MSLRNSKVRPAGELQQGARSLHFLHKDCRMARRGTEKLSRTLPCLVTEIASTQKGTELSERKDTHDVCINSNFHVCSSCFELSLF